MKSAAPGPKRRAKNRFGGRPQPKDKAPIASRRDYPRQLLVGFALGALTLLAFSNSFQSGFILDNKGLLLDPRIREATAENIALIFRHTYWWPTGESGLYRPFTTLSYLFNYALLAGGADPAGYHWINLLLHLGNVWLAYALALRLIGRFWPSVFTAALWAVHPALTESVTNIVGRADLLAAMAVLSGFLMYLKSVEAAGMARAFWLAGLAVATTIGVFSKESAIAILPIIVLYELVPHPPEKVPKSHSEPGEYRGVRGSDDPPKQAVTGLVWWRERARLRALALGCLATLLPIAAMLYQRAIVLAASPPAELPFTDNPIAGAAWWTGRITAIKVMARYLWLTVWPAKLSSDYSYNQIALARGAAVDWLACAAVLAVATAVILLYRRNHACFFLACFAFLNFVPASNLLIPIGTIMADRLLYLPSLGLLGCLTLAIYTVAAQSRRTAVAIPVLLSLVVAGFAVRTWLRNRDWQSELAIASADVRVSPDSFKIHRLLASSLFESDPSHLRIDAVIAEIEKSLALLDSLPAALGTPEVYRQAGYYYLVKSRQPGQAENDALRQKAIQCLLRGITIDEAGRAAYRAHNGFSAIAKGDPQAYLLLSMAYLDSGNPDKALEAASQASALDHLNPKVYRQLSAVFLAQGHRPEAAIAATLEDAITSWQQRNWPDAAALSDRVLHLDPAGYSAAYDVNAMANLRLGNLDAAESAAREAMRLDRGGGNSEAGYILGLALAQKRDYKQAVELLNAYLNTAPNPPDAEIVRRQLSQIESLAQARSPRQ